MGFCEFLTILFVGLKLIGYIDWSWWLVLLPELIAIGLYIILLCLEVHSSKQFDKRIRKMMKEMDK